MKDHIFLLEICLKTYDTLNVDFDSETAFLSGFLNSALPN